MDLQDFECSDMYFNEPIGQEVERLIERASAEYGTEKAEASLLHAYFLAPENLAVLVALYRYYYYQHEYIKAIKIACRAMATAGNRLGLPRNWKNINEACMGEAVMISMGLLRFYLLSLKGAAYLSLRLNRIDAGIEMLKKLVELDPRDRLQVKFLLDMAQEKSNITDNVNVVSFRRYSAFSVSAK